MIDDGLSYLEVSFAGEDGDTREPPPYRNSRTELLGFGMHVTEVDVTMGTLIEMVRLQAE